MLSAKIETTVNGHKGTVAFRDDGSHEFLIDGKRSGINTYDLEYFGRGWQHANRPCQADKTYCYPENFLALLAEPVGDLITVIAQAIMSDEVRGEINAEIAARQQAIAPAETWVLAINVADGWDLTIGYAKHSNSSVWLFRSEGSYKGAAEQAIKNLIYSWDLARVSGTQSGVIYISTENQMEQVKDVGKAANSAEQKEKIAREIIETEAALESYGDPQKLPTKTAALANRRAYNNGVNEGGDGYVPYFPSSEDYQYYTEKLATLQGQLNAL